MSLITIRNILIYISIIGFFFFPFYQTHVIALGFLLTFFTGEFKDFMPSFKNNKAGVVLFVFFIIHLFSLLYSNDLSFGTKGLEIKFSFFIFPLFLPIIFHSKKININLIFKVLIFSGIGYVISSFVMGFYNYLIYNDFKYLLSSNLGFRIGQDGPFLHPTYVSIYINFILLYIGYNFIKTKYFINKKITVLTIVLFLIFILFSTSKIGILLVGINVFIILSYFAIYKNKVKKAILIFITFISISIIGIYNSPVKGRFQEVYEQVVLKQFWNRDYCLSTQTRMMTWKASKEIIKENPYFGVGIGDIRNDLQKKYKELGFACLKGKGLDSHQQFLQTFATIGISGILTLLLLFFILFRKAIKTKNLILFSFTLFYFLFGLTESFLETQAGIVFFTFFAILLYHNSTEKETEIF